MSFAVLCPGQGDQSPAMFDLIPEAGAGAALLTEAANLLGQDPRRISPAQLMQNDFAQPATAAAELALWRELRDHLPEPALFAGYSLGELIAYGCAGALDGFELLRLAANRAALMDGASGEQCGLRAVRGLMAEELRRLCQSCAVEIAIKNDLDRFVVGGRLADLARFERKASDLGAKVTLLQITVASHTSFMIPAMPSFRDLLSASGLRDSNIPVLRGIDAAAVTGRLGAIEALSRQLAEPLDWSACLDAMHERGCRVLLELGPGSGLSRMARDRWPDLAVRSAAEFHSISGIVDWVMRGLA